MRRSWPWMLLTAGTLLGCGSSGGSSPDDDDDNEEMSELPILERESEAAYACSVKTDLLNYMPRAWLFGSAALVGRGDGAFLARVETEVSDIGAPINPFALVVSPIAADGALGASNTVPVSDPTLVSAPALLALDAEHTALVWVEGDALRFATLDAQGKPGVATTILSGDIDSLSRPRLALGSAGTLGLAFRDALGTARFVEIDDKGQRVNDAIELGEGRVDAVPEILSFKGGFALLWSAIVGEPDNDGYFPSPEVFFVAIDANGKVKGEVQQVSAAKASNTFLIGSFFSPSKVALVPNGDGFLSAWSEGRYGSPEGEEPSGGFSVIKLARLDAEGKRVGDYLQLDEKKDSVDDVEASLVPFGDALAVLWARGSHIFICGGCVPDDDLHAVLIDPGTLTPLSNVVKVGAELGGLLRRQTLVQGNDILAALEITFHTSSHPAFAAFHCE